MVWTSSFDLNWFSHAWKVYLRSQKREGGISSVFWVLLSIFATEPICRKSFHFFLPHFTQQTACFPAPYREWDLISMLHLRSSDSYYSDADVSHSSSLAWWKLKPKLWMKYILAAKQFKPSTVTYIVLVVISSTARGTRVLKRLQ